MKSITVMSYRFWLCGLLLIAGQTTAQTNSVLYATLVKTKGYVGGSKLSASGLYRFNGDSTWTHIGWNNPRVYGITADPKNSKIIYLACGNGVLRTLNGGQSWRMTTDWRITEVLDVSVDPTSPQNVYAATAYGIWRSGDRGENWFESNSGLTKKYSQSIEVDRTKTKRIFTGTEGGLYLSNDGAWLWYLVGPKDIMVLDIQQSRSFPHIWLAGAEKKGVLISKDEGKTWHKASGPINHASIYSVAIDPFDAKNMAAAGWDTGFFISTDEGQNWRQYKEGLPTPNIYDSIFDANYPGQLWVATVEEGIFKSTDLAKSWQYHGMSGALIFAMIFIPKEQHDSISN